MPSWTRPNQQNKVSLLTNARRETVKDLPSFKGALMNRKRCVVVSTGFYEWEKGPTKSSRKTPFVIRLGTPGGARDVLLMAGLYDIWNPPGGGDPLYSYTICTTETNEQFEWLHHRLPCILESEKDVLDWLDVGGLPGDIAADRVLRTAKESLVWTQMSSDLTRETGTPSSKHVKPNIKSFFKKKVEQKSEQKVAQKAEPEPEPEKKVEKNATAELAIQPKTEVIKIEDDSDVVDSEVQPATDKLLFSKSIAERTLGGRNARNLTALQSPIRKPGANSEKKRSTPKKSPKRHADPNQKSITAFFRKTN